MTATSPTPATPAAAAAADMFYDARRGVYYAKPMMRGWLHLLWFGASLVLSTVLLTQTHGLARVYSLEDAPDKARAVLLDLLKQHPDHAQAQAMLAELPR